MCSRVIGRSSAKGVCVGRGWWLVDNDLLFIRSECIGSALDWWGSQLIIIVSRKAYICVWSVVNRVMWRKADLLAVVDWWLVSDTGLPWFVFEPYYIDVGVSHKVKCIVEVRDLLNLICDEFGVGIIDF